MLQESQQAASSASSPLCPLLPVQMREGGARGSAQGGTAFSPECPPGDRGPCQALCRLISYNQAAWRFQSFHFYKRGPWGTVCNWLRVTQLTEADQEVNQCAWLQRPFHLRCHIIGTTWRKDSWVRKMEEQSWVAEGAPTALTVEGWKKNPKEIRS